MLLELVPEAVLPLSPLLLPPPPLSLRDFFPLWKFVLLLLLLLPLLSFCAPWDDLIEGLSPDNVLDGAGTVSTGSAAMIADFRDQGRNYLLLA